MTNNRTVTCQHCKKELPRDHKGPCPFCGSNEILFQISVGGGAVGIKSSLATTVRRELDKHERGLWDKFVTFFKGNIIVDGFEIGFPSGIKIKFRTKSGVDYEERARQEAGVRGQGELINMAQYDPLRDYLSECKGNELTLTFKEIDKIIAPKALPASAYNLRQFWQNSYSPGRRHVQAIAWHNAGWKVSEKNLQQQLVTFCRRLNEHEATP